MNTDRLARFKNEFRTMLKESVDNRDTSALRTMLELLRDLNSVYQDEITDLMDIVRGKNAEDRRRAGRREH
jgi:hypothetical protein